jgi:two-component system response regulator HydG
MDEAIVDGTVLSDMLTGPLTIVESVPGQLSNANLVSPNLTNEVPELIGKSMDAIERWAIEQTLKITNGNREEAAKILDIGARTLYRKLDKYKEAES